MVKIMETELPGKRIRELRKKAGYSMRSFAAACNPPMDFTTVGRIEKNLGYTGDSLERFARVLDCEVSDFFLPDELAAFAELPADMRDNVARHIEMLRLANKNRTA